MPGLLHAIQVRCSHKTVDGRKLSDRGTTRVAIIYRYAGKGWTTAEPVYDPHSFHSKAPEGMSFGVVTCPVCGSNTNLSDPEVQIALDSYIDWKQRPNQILIHYVNQNADRKRDPRDPLGEALMDPLADKWAAERKALERKKAEAKANGWDSLPPF